MKAPVLPLHGEEHLAVQALLPWFVNATLEGAESLRVREHLRSCAQCKSDVDAQVRLRALREELESQGKVGRDWAALQNRLKSAVESPGGPAAGRERAATWQRWLPVAFACQFALVLALAISWFAIPRADPAYRVLGASASSSEANVLAVFRAEAPEAQIRAALRSSGARIVGGPTVTDAYLLHVTDAGPQALKRLRDQPAVARVESLEAGNPK